MTPTVSSSRMVGHLAQAGAPLGATPQAILVEFHLITCDARQPEGTDRRFGARAIALCRDLMGAAILTALSWLASFIITGLIHCTFCNRAGDPDLLATVQAPSTMPARGQILQTTGPGECR